MGKDKEFEDYNSEDPGECKEVPGGQNKMLPDDMVVHQKSDEGSKTGKG